MQTSSSFIVCSDITERIIAHLIPSSFNLCTSIQSFLRLRLVSKHFKTDVEHLARLWIRRYLTTRSNSRLCKFISYAPILWSLPGVRPVDWSRVSQDPWNSDSGLWDAESGFRRWLLSLARDVDMVRVCDLLVTRGRQNVPNEAAGRILAMLGFRGKENARMWDRVLQSSVVLLGYGEALINAVEVNDLTVRASEILGGMNKEDTLEPPPPPYQILNDQYSNHPTHPMHPDHLTPLEAFVNPDDAAVVCVYADYQHPESNLLRMWFEGVDPVLRVSGHAAAFLLGTVHSYTLFSWFYPKVSTELSKVLLPFVVERLDRRLMKLITRINWMTDPGESYMDIDRLERWTNIWCLVIQHLDPEGVLELWQSEIREVINMCWWVGYHDKLLVARAVRFVRRLQASAPIEVRHRILEQGGDFLTTIIEGTKGDRGLTGRFAFEAEMEKIFGMAT